MTKNEYLRKILASQEVRSSSDEMKVLRKAKQEVEDTLRAEFTDASPTIRYGGSKAKGTMVLESYDLDITCYFENEDNAAGETLADIFFNVRNALSKAYGLTQKKSAIRLFDANGSDFHIDVVPGRYTDDSKSDVFLYQAEGEKSRLKTNLQTHIDHISGSGVTDCIKLMKLWALRNGVNVKTFVLELAVVELLKGKSGASIEDQFVHVLTKLKNDIDEIQIVDPANPEGNDLSGVFDNSVRSQLSMVASASLDHVENGNWSNVLGEVVDMDPSEAASSLTAAAATVSSDAKPWVET